MSKPVSRAEAGRRWRTDRLEQGDRVASGLDAENGRHRGRSQAPQVIRRRADSGRPAAQRRW